MDPPKGQALVASGWEAASKQLRAAIASHARKFTGEEAREMWIQDPGYDYYANATQRFAELDVMAQGFKKHYLITDSCLDQSKP